MTRKRIVRAVVREIVVRVEHEQIKMLVHWQGGDHTALSVKKNKIGRHRWSAEPEIGPLIRALARQLPDKAIAALLNRLGKTTGRRNGWTQSRVCTFRNQHDIGVYKHGERTARGEYTLQEAAERLDVSPMTVLRMIRSGSLPAKQYCKGTPWVIRREDIERPETQTYANRHATPVIRSARSTGRAFSMK
ncbi:helix-turn-helix domain-containing protein [Mesorhizobium sp. LSJC265A00]|uniref:helix-turn-helix domain-containing protein n=1 Tax=Mesorhizobium sp. LSJC265A00 TaxID=1287322 RepID=UPI001FD8984F|nr:helix-turn-helix domain-containing protein [Mesorhizobium sp. LSJC265A00]